MSITTAIVQGLIIGTVAPTVYFFLGKWKP
jgi:hypothetical protein